MPAPALLMQTTYAELLERCSATAFNEEFPEDGAFVSKTIRGRRYWYFQTPGAEGRPQKYVGPETSELLARIEHHRAARSDERERRALVSTLTRSFGLPRPIAPIGDTVAALARAGVFRLRGVLVGTVAYQTYPAMLGVKLPRTGLQTNDVDIAQFLNVSVAVGDRTPPMLDTLQAVDRSFREVPHLSRGHRVTAYVARGGLRVDFLTPNEGRETDTPRHLPALQTDAQPLRFLDFLIHDPQPAVLLHEAGVYVQVPGPERYAVHKLILAGRRASGAAKREKDLLQAEALLEVLAERRPKALQLAWQEASQRGPTWRRLLAEGVGELAPRSRDLTLQSAGITREALPGLDLTFKNPPARYDTGRDLVLFAGEALGAPVECAISREALEDHFGADNLDERGRVETFLKNRSRIEALARAKYLSWPVEEPQTVLIRTTEVDKLRQTSAKRRVRAAVSSLS